MYISEITIDGFKSYASRVTLSGFDPAFNAITGLNGSGKSNILDSICFVLGIKNLSQVRATNLQELVYKQGQAGITKASVSITWHNNDPKSGPAGYEDKEYITITRTIVIGGRNKYLINGHAAQENRVQDLFHSVQLNVNNPHFLIMQGRITKVLNMKPPEIMSLLEEAAGTRMYEKKKDAAVRTLEKKQQRLEQIDSVLQGDILPSLEALRKQCSTYNEWAQLRSRSEVLKRLCIAWEYVEGTKKLAKYQEEASKLEAKAAEEEAERGRLQAEADELSGQVRDLQTEKEIQAGGELKELGAKVDELKMKLTKDQTQWKQRSESAAAERKELGRLQAALKELAEQDLEAKVTNATAARDSAREALQASEAAVEAATRELAGAEAGDGRDESNRSLQERLADAQNAQTTADSEAQQAEVRAKHLTKQLAEQKKLLSSKEKEGSTLQRDLAKHNAAVQQCQERLKALAFDEGMVARLEEAREQASASVRQLRNEVDRLSHEVSGCDFRYTNPRPDFDPSQVHGVVARLVHVQDPSTSLALEVAAGGKLYQVVVSNERTAKELLEKGKLQKRVTIIPLNKIQYGTMSGSVLEAAQRLGGGRARPALELVGYEGSVEAAIKYVFGTCFVCQDAGTAKKLAFSREVGQRCITLEGDDFNPSGLLTGGSRSVQRSVLALLHELSAAEQQLAQQRHALSQAEMQLQQIGPNAREHRRLTQELELAQHQLTLLRERIAGSEGAQLAEQVEALTTQLAEAQQAAVAAREKKTQLVAQAKALETEIRDFDKERGSRIKGAQDKLKKAKADLETKRKALRKAEQAVQEAVAEKDAAAGERKTLEQRVQQAEASIAGLEKEVAELQAAVDRAKQAHDEAHARLQAKKARLHECDQEIAALEKERDALLRKVAEADSEGRKKEKKVKEIKEHVQGYQDRLVKLESEYNWIANEKASFGRGDYDFGKHDMNKVKAEYLQGLERLEQLKGKTDPKAGAKLETAEAEFRNLQEKRTIVEKDRARIEQVINELDTKKRNAMADTWQKVNTSFGSIFSTLLPGTEAKLEPPEGQTFEAGLEVRVAFGGVWKESLTELSGGQRSLLALSLILALCRFKPAPLYILDEVDAALDLNHTQNIGRMIKQYFPQSQFVVVSLKEGMFNNANVVFRTKFVDGVSTVTRTVMDRAAIMARDRENAEAAAAAAAGKGATQAGGRGRQALKDAANRV